jgi:hypothetical protein
LSFRIARVHACFDQARIFAYVEPFLQAEISKQQLQEIWKEAAKQLGETRPEKCRCSYRVTTTEAELLVKNGIADYLITDWRYNADKKIFFPAPNPNLVWGGKKAEDLGLIRSSLAQKTPRVMTIEKANIERAYVDGRKDEIERIEVWGELARGVIRDLTSYYEHQPFDPFKGCPVLSIPVGWEPRSSIGTDV